MPNPETENRDRTPCRYDFHIHTKHLGCANATMEVAAIVRECERLGATAIALTDHLNTLDRLEKHIPIREDLDALDTRLPVYFGVELNFTGCDEGFAYSEEVRDLTGFQFAIGGIHGTYLPKDGYDVKKVVDIQHRHHLKTCRDPLVSVLVHPYWFGRGEFIRNEWPWFDTMKHVPASYVRELGQTARETGTAIEINGASSLDASNGPDWVKGYMDFLAALAAEGVRFSFGSDSHDIHGLENVRRSWDAAAALRLRPEQIWRPAGPPRVGGR